MKTTLAVVVLGLGLAASGTPLLAHHSVGAQFDIDKTITVQGTVTQIEWANPHARIWVDAKNDDGTVSNWEMQLPPPNALVRRDGLKKDFIKQGDHVIVNLWRAKDGSRLAHTLTLTVPGGRVLNFPTTDPFAWKPVASK